MEQKLYTKKELRVLMESTGYPMASIEKTIRLMELLRAINEDAFLSENLTLKGGTAINIIHYSEIPRLSVDLDFDLARNTRKDEMLAVKDEVSEYCIKFQFLGVRDKIALGSNDPVRIGIVLDEIKTYILGIVETCDQIHMDHGYLPCHFDLLYDLGDRAYISVKYKYYLNIFGKCYTKSLVIFHSGDNGINLYFVNKFTIFHIYKTK